MTADGAIVTIRFKIRSMCAHDEPNWERLVRECIEDDGIMGIVDDAGEIVSIEKWNGD